MSQLAEMAASDPVLTAEILRIANSPFFGLVREVNSVQQAVVLLGQQTLRNLVLCIAVKDVLNNVYLPDLDVTSLWESTLRRATAAELLAVNLGLEIEKCFTAGLLQDLGLLVLLTQDEDCSRYWPELKNLPPTKRLVRERELFGTDHAAVAELLAQAWSLPSELTAALAHHHACDSMDCSTLCAVLHCADWIAAVFEVENEPGIIDDCHHCLTVHLSLDRENSEQILNALPARTESAARALGLRINPQADLQKVLENANLQLVEANLSYQQLTWELQQTLDERNQLAAELDRELQLAREIQQSLLPAPAGSDGPLFGINIAAHKLSGDFFDFFQLEDGRYYFNIADVSGKGINAALLMAKTSSLFRCLGKRIHHPGTLLKLINEELCETSVRGMFVTLVAGQFEPETGTVRIVNAGGPPGIFIDKDKRTTPFGASSVPLGVMPDTDFTVEEFSLGKGSLYFFTDGIIEAKTSRGKPLEIEGLLQILLKYTDQPPAERLHLITEHLCNTSETFRDDITLLILDANA